MTLVYKGFRVQRQQAEIMNWRSQLQNWSVRGPGSTSVSSLSVLSLPQKSF